MKTCLGLLLLTGSSFAIKVGVINDIHFNPLYDSTTSLNACFGASPIFELCENDEFDLSKQTSPLSSEPNAPLGRRECDPPLETIDSLMKIM